LLFVKGMLGTFSLTFTLLLGETHVGLTTL